MQTPKLTRSGLVLLAATACVATTGAANAQEDNPFIEEIIITATKRAGGIDVQEAPVAISAFNESQLDQMYIRNLQAIGYEAPSVQLEDIGTTRGTANFSIRGLGVNSSIPSIDPTVGVFIDGVYLGVNAGVVLDIFDLEGVEVLRGPQGLLFGRNVTGGAVLLRTTRPSDALALNTRVAYETGNNGYFSGVLSGPLGDQFGGKIAVYYNNDDGWHTNLADGSTHGKAETTMVRAAFDWRPNDVFDIILRAETSQSEGDGPAAQNRGCAATPVPGLCTKQYDLDKFEFSINERGFYDNKTDMASLEFSWDVGGGDGQIVNILGWRQYESTTNGDIDSTPLFLFHAPSSIKQDQISNELRYAGSIGDHYLTTGVYYFTQDVVYREQRIIPPSMLDITGGGDYTQDTVGVFAQFDWTVTDDIVINLGGRYTQEDKDAKIATIPFNFCVVEGGCSMFDFAEKRSWTSFTPKIGIQIAPNDDGQIYAFWTKGFRSGGYNLRHTAVAIPNASFDQEEQNSYEVGWKQDWAGGMVRTNFAAYINSIDNLQRELNLADPVVGVVQLIRNTADATIAGFDAEIDWALTDSFYIQLTAGYVDGSYTSVRFDLNGDGVIDDADKALALPRLSPWSYGLSFTYTQPIGNTVLTAQASGYHRDEAAYTDNNLGTLPAHDFVDANIGLLFFDEQLKLSVFGRNLLDEVTIGGDTQLPFFPGATFSPLNKGRTYGVELQYRTN